jgi:hypothetical protein
MKVIKEHRNGFTLMELLVGINISFIVITLMVSVYLFLFKFMLSTSRNVEAKINITSGMERLVSELYKCESFELRFDDEFISVVTENNRQIIFKPDSIILNEICLITGIDDYEMNVRMVNGDSKYIVDGKIADRRVFANDMNALLSHDIRRLNLEVSYKDHVYRAEYFTPQISTNRFTNIYRQ